MGPLLSAGVTLLGWVIGAALLVGVLKEKLAQLGKQLSDFEAKLEHLDECLDRGMDATRIRLNTLETKVAFLEGRFGAEKA